MSSDAAKRAAALAALEHIEPMLTLDAFVGVGTGSTANHFIDALARIKHKFDAAVASSEVTANRLKAAGVPVIDLNAAKSLVVYVDGADEVDPHLNLIKGAGGALTREKIVATASERFVCIVDESKCVDILGRFPLPVEVIPMARSLVGRALVALGGVPELRENYKTDNGNLILDTRGFTITDPGRFESTLNDIAGVVCNGIFAHRRADEVIVGSASGTRLVRGAGSSP